MSTPDSAGRRQEGAAEPATPTPSDLSGQPTASGASDAFGSPEPPDRGAQDAFLPPGAAPSDSETWHRTWSEAQVPPTPGMAAPPGSVPPPPGSVASPPGPAPAPSPGYSPYVGGQPAPTPFPSGHPFPYPAPPGYARPGAGQAGWQPGPDAYARTSGGYPPPTTVYPSPYGYAMVDPYAKSRTVAGILGILLGGLGVHRFYLGYVGIGLIQIAVTIITFGAGALWGFVEGILYLTQRTGQFSIDATGRPLRD